MVTLAVHIRHQSVVALIVIGRWRHRLQVVVVGLRAVAGAGCIVRGVIDVIHPVVSPAATPGAGNGAVVVDGMGPVSSRGCRCRGVVERGVVVGRLGVARGAVRVRGWRGLMAGRCVFVTCA